MSCCRLLLISHSFVGQMTGRLLVSGSSSASVLCHRLWGNKLFTTDERTAGRTDGWVRSLRFMVVYQNLLSSEMKERTERSALSLRCLCVPFACSSILDCVLGEEICATDRVNPFLDFLSASLPSDHFLNYLDRAKVKTARVHLSIHVASPPIDE